MKKFRLTLIYLITVMFLIVGASALAESADDTPSYIFIVDDTRPILNSEQIGNYLKTLSGLLDILDGDEDSIAMLELRALSDPQNKVYRFTANQFAPDVVYGWLNDVDRAVYTDDPDIAFLDGLGNDRCIIWIMGQTDEQMLKDNYLMQYGHVSQKRDAKNERVESSFDKANALYENGLLRIKAFKEKIKADEHVFVIESINPAEAFSAACSIMKRQKREDFVIYEGDFVTDNNATDLNVLEYFIVSNKPFRAENETATRLFDGAYYLYVSDSGVSVQGDELDETFAVLTKTTDLRLVQYQSRQEPYSWGDTISSIYHIKGKDGDVITDNWNFYAVVTSTEDGSSSLVNLSAGEEGISFEYKPTQFGHYSYIVYALNTLSGEELKAKPSAFSVVNKAPEYLGKSNVIVQLETSPLQTNNAQSIELSHYYIDDKDGSNLTYYVNGEIVSGGVFEFDPDKYTAGASLSVRVVDSNGADNTEGFINVVYHGVNEIAAISQTKESSYTLGWTGERDIPLTLPIELTTLGKSISAADKGDIWLAQANIYKDNELEKTVSLSLTSSGQGKWLYEGHYELEDYGSYRISYTASVKEAKGEVLEGKINYFSLQNTSPELNSEEGHIETLKAAGLIYEEKTYSFDLNKYYSDDRDSENLIYEFRRSGEEEYAFESDYAKIDGNTITFKPEGLTESFTVQIRATDREGEQNDKGYFEIQYTPVSEAAKLSMLSYDKEKNEISWHEHRVKLQYDISLTQAGQNLPAKSEGDIWSVQVSIYANGQYEGDAQLKHVSSANGRWVYEGEYELNNYGSYSAVCVAAMAGATEQKLASVTTNFNVFNTAPELINSVEGKIATVKAAGLMYANETYKFDLSNYYSDDRNGASLKYEFMLEDGSYTQGAPDDFAEINGSTIEFKNELIDRPLIVKIRVTDGEGLQNEEGYFEIQYKAAEEIAEIYMRSPSANEKEKFKWQTELFEVKCEIRLKDEIDHKAFSNKQSDWRVIYSVSLKDAAQDAPVYYELSNYNDGSSSGHRGTVTTDIINDSGTYLVHLRAENKATGAILNRVVTVEINDEPPKLVEEKLENKENTIIKTYYASALDPDYVAQIDLSENYYDRKDEVEGKALTIYIDGSITGFGIENNKAQIYANLFKRNQSIAINAEDNNRQVNSDGRIQILYIDFASFVKEFNDNAPVKLRTENNDAYTRFDTIEYDISYDIPKSALDIDIDFDGVVVDKTRVKNEVDNDLFPRYKNTIVAEYKIYYQGAEDATNSSGRLVYSDSIDFGNGVKTLKIRPYEMLREGEETVRPGTYRIILELLGGVGNNREMISECKQEFVIKNNVPMDKGLIPNSFEHQILWKADKKTGEDIITINLRELASAEPDEKLSFIVSMGTSTDKGESEYKLYQLPEGGYLISALPVSDATPVIDGKIVWATKDSDKNLNLNVDVSTHGRNVLNVKVVDDDGAGFKKEISFTTLYRYEKEIIIAVLALVAIIILILLYKLIRYLLKPCFKEEDMLKLTYNGRDTRFKLQSWKKTGITLREIMIYAGVAFAGDISLKECDEIVFLPAKGSYDFVVRLSKNKGPTLIMGGAEQSTGFKVPSGTTVTVKLTEEESMNIVRVIK